MAKTQNHAAEFSITEKEVKRLVDAALTFRDRVLIKTLYYTAIRREELCNLHVKVVDLERRRILEHQGIHPSTWGSNGVRGAMGLGLAIQHERR